MGCYPQGNNKFRRFKTLDLIWWSWDKGYHKYASQRPDRYKSYRAQRRFKMRMQGEGADS